MNPDKPADNDDGIIELTQIVKSGHGTAKFPKIPAQSPSNGDLTRFDETDNNLEKLVRDVVEDFPPDTANPSGSAQIPMDQIEAALERVVKKMYSKKMLVNQLKKLSIF